jgi:Ca2+-dependent lipid-binding protein
MDVMGKVDGFARVHANGKMIGETPVVKKNYDPVWNFSCGPFPLDTYGPALKIELWDWDAAGSNDRIAKFVIKSLLDLLAMVGNAILVNNLVVSRKVGRRFLSHVSFL